MGFHPDQFVKNLKTGVVFEIDFHAKQLPALDPNVFIHAFDQESDQKQIDEIKKGNPISFILSDGNNRDQVIISDNVCGFDLFLFDEYFQNDEYDLETLFENYNGQKYSIVRDDGMVIEVWDHDILDVEKLEALGFKIHRTFHDLDSQPAFYLFINKKHAIFYHFFSHRNIDLNDTDIYQELYNEFRESQ